MDKVRERILEYITKGIVKSEGIKKLKKEFGGTEKELSNLWISVKEENQINRNRSRVNKVIKENKKEMDKKIDFDIKPVKREFKCKLGSFIRTEEGVTFEGFTFKSKEEIEHYRNIIDAADLIMDMSI